MLLFQQGVLRGEGLWSDEGRKWWGFYEGALLRTLGCDRVVESVWLWTLLQMILVEDKGYPAEGWGTKILIWTEW